MHVLIRVTCVRRDISCRKLRWKVSPLRGFPSEVQVHHRATPYERACCENTRADTQPPPQRDTRLCSHRKMYLFAIRRETQGSIFSWKENSSRGKVETYIRGIVCERISFPPYYIGVFSRSIFFSPMRISFKKRPSLSFKLKRETCYILIILINP